MIKSKILDLDNIDSKKETVYFENQCYTPSHITGKSFCDGFSEGIDSVVNSFALNTKSFRYSCEPIPYIDNDDLNTKRFQSINDTNIQKLIPHQIININQDIEQINTQTNEKRIIKKNINKLIAKNELGIRKDEFCETDLNQSSDKFCKGFEKAIDIISQEANLDRSKIISNCISEPIALEKKRKIIYGIK